MLVLHHFPTERLPARAETVPGVSEPLCSRSSDKKDTTPGRMKVCANIPVEVVSIK